MKAFKARGNVVGGCQKFRELIRLPDNLLAGHEDWMPTFVQGTLNVEVPIASLPNILRSDGFKGLDLNELFPPAIYRAGADVPSNTIQPNTQNPRRGDVQLWRTTMDNLQTRTSFNCFIIRRVESGYKNIAEILGQLNFRDECRFEDGHQISIQVFSGTGET